MGGDRPDQGGAQSVNLRLARKRHARKARRRAADENAARHGQSKAARRLAEARADRARRMLDAHRREGDDGDGPPDGGEE